MTSPLEAPPRQPAEREREAGSGRRLPTLELGATPLLAVLAAAGVLMVAFGNNAAREGSAVTAPLLFWSGLIVIYAPFTFRLLSQSATRAERIALVLALGLALFVVRVLYSPALPTPYDELATWRGAFDLITAQDFFTFNPLVEGYAGFPGLETVMATTSQLADVSLFHAGQIVIGLSRVTLMLAIFLFLERATGSTRAAGIGAAIYVANPSFLYFDAQIGHESLGLPLAAVLLLLAVRWVDRRDLQLDARVAWGLAIGMGMLASSLTITHHMSSYMMAAFFCVWAGLAAWDARRGQRPSVPKPWRDPRGATAAIGGLLLRGPALPAALMTGAAAGWFIFVAGGYTVNELGGVLTGSVESLVNVVVGESETKVLFHGSGQANPAAARTLAIGSIVPLLAMIPLGMRRIWFASDRESLWRPLALVATLFPVTLGLRLTLAGSETSQRASEFVFVGLAFLGALLIGELRWPARKTGRVLAAAGLTLAATTVFIGGVIISTLPANRQPGTFIVSAEARSVSNPNLAAARFASEYLPPESRVLADRPNATLLGSFGHLNPVFGQIDGIPITRVLFREEFGPIERRVIVDDAIEYIVVDRRQSSEVPLVGYYVESFEPRAFTRQRPLSEEALRKFDDVPGLSRVYDNGTIAIYDTSGLR